MSAQIMKVARPLSFERPRNIEWISTLVARLSRIGEKVWRVLEEVGRARAEREMQRLSVQYAHEAEFAYTLRNAMHDIPTHR
jgi:hypothetical protein